VAISSGPGSENNRGAGNNLYPPLETTNGPKQGPQKHKILDETTKVEKTKEKYLSICHTVIQVRKSCWIPPYFQSLSPLQGKICAKSTPPIHIQKLLSTQNIDAAKATIKTLKSLLTKHGIDTSMTKKT
jgi:hypothetical protein